MALEKGTKIYSIMKFKCPQCHEGDYFVSHPYDLKNIGKLKPECPHCGLKYAKEPGFYFGSMYVTYAFSVAIFCACIVLYYWTFGRIDAWNLLLIIGAVSIVLAPISHALSKIIWINFFTKYDPSSIERYQVRKVEEIH